MEIFPGRIYSLEEKFSPWELAEGRAFTAHRYGSGKRLQRAVHNHFAASMIDRGVRCIPRARSGTLDVALRTNVVENGMMIAERILPSHLRCRKLGLNRRFAAGVGRAGRRCRQFQSKPGDFLIHFANVLVGLVVDEPDALSATGAVCEIGLGGGGRERK